MIEERRIRDLKDLLEQNEIDDPGDLFEDIDIIIELCEFWLENHED